MRVLVINHATATGRDATFERFTPTLDTVEHDGPVRVVRVGRWANVAKLDIPPGLPRALRRLLRDPPDIWHLHAPNITMMLAVLAFPKVRPLVITHHSDIVRQRFLRHVVKPVETAMYRQAAAVLSDSPGYVDGSPLLQRFAGKVAVLPLGIDLSPFRDPSPQALAHATAMRERFGSPLWLCVGRLIYYKGLDVALAALRDVPGRLLIIGTGPLEGELRRRAAELGVADRVVWAGHSSPDQLIGAYHAATALWFPSVARSEGFGLVQVEAMTAGCPVINTAIPGSGVPWVCRHEEEGLTVPVNDAAKLADAAKRLLNEPGLRDRLAAAGRARAATEFDHRVMGERSLEIYRGVIQPNKATHPARTGGRRPTLRVLHAYSGNLYGGLEAMLAVIARSAGEVPTAEHHFALCFEGQLSGELRAAGAPVHMLEPVRVSRPWTVWRARQALRRVISRVNPDVVVCHSPWPLAVLGPAAKTAGKPVVFWLHQYLTGQAVDQRWARRCRPALVIANSKYSAGSVGRLFQGVPVEVVYCPYRLSRVEPTTELRREVRAELDTPADARVVFQASRLEWWKGQRLHLKALADLRHLPGWVCWMAGGAQRPEEHAYLAELQALAAAMGIADRVRFLGHRRDIPRLLAAADIVCHPNEAPEHFGIALVEGLAASKPVIATKMGGAVEVIDSTCGVLTEANPAAVATALAELVPHPDRCAALGAAGPARAVALCDPVRNLAKFHALMARILS